MGRPLSVTLSYIYMAKMEDDIVEKYQLKFYKRYVDDIINHRMATISQLSSRVLKTFRNAGLGVIVLKRMIFPLRKNELT